MNKKYTYAAVGVAALALIIWGIYALSDKNSQNNAQQAAQSGSSGGAAVATTTPTSTPASAAVPAQKLSYEAALKAYPERFQFDQCQGTPATIAVRKGTPVMLDNRDPAAHVFKADTRTYDIAGYGYDVFYPEVLGNLTVSCDGKPRVTLNVEK